MVIDITGEEVKEAVMNAGVTKIPERACSLCGYVIGYEVHKGTLFFNGSCDCAQGQLRQRSWSSIARWINEQTDSDARRLLMNKFHIKSPLK